MDKKKLLNILNKLPQEDICFLTRIIFKDEIEVIKEKANYLRKMPCGAGGQSISLQVRNQYKGQLGSSILKCIKEYEDAIKNYFGEL